MVINQVVGFRPLIKDRYPHEPFPWMGQLVFQQSRWRFLSNSYNTNTYLLNVSNWVLVIGQSDLSVVVQRLYKDLKRFFLLPHFFSLHILYLVLPICHHSFSVFSFSLYISTLPPYGSFGCSLRIEKRMNISDSEWGLNLG